jgi:aryl-alcohol dehydrogenase-like predicted oxidoreductase
MEYRQFGQTGMRLSVIGLGGLLARYEGACGHPPPEEKHAIYLRAAELGINLFDMGYGDEVHIPDELKGNAENRYFSLKVGAPRAGDLEGLVDKHLLNLRRDAIDILRVHQYAYLQDEPLAERIAALKQQGKVRALCLIRHYQTDQKAYAEDGPEADADADLVIYNYVCRWQEPGIRQSGKAGKGVLIMKALGGQWIGWNDQTRTDWTYATKETVIQLAPRGEAMRPDLELVYPIVAGPWYKLARAGELIPRTERAIQWVLVNRGVSSVLVAVASVEELEEALGI